MKKHFSLTTILLYLLISCNNGNGYKSVEDDNDYNFDNNQKIEIVQSSEVEDELMVTCPICFGNGEGEFFGSYQICPVCKGDKVIPQKWIDEANQQLASRDVNNNLEEEASDMQRQYIESEISRLESVIQMAETALENCTSEILIIQYKNQITEAEYEIRRLQNLR